jgi:hypothetical protein
VRLKPTFRFTLYGAFIFLLFTGAAWLLADRLKESGDLWQQIAADLLMLHGGAAMVTLMILGALVPLHVERGWRAQKNRAAGVVMVICNALLVATAFGLYYAGSDTLRPWISEIHITAGFVLPALFATHVALGRLSV